jgi:hypothetical protein
MSARFRTIAYTLTGSVVTLSTILNNSLDEFVGSFTLRADKSNVANVTWSDTGGSIGGYLEPREAATFDLATKYVKAAHVQLNGTVGDVVYITVIG